MIVAVVAVACASQRVDHGNDYLLEPIPRGGVEFGLGTRHFDPEALRDAIAHDSRPEIRVIAVMRLEEEIHERAVPDLRAALADPASIVAARAAHELANLGDLDSIRQHVVRIRALVSDAAAREDAEAALAAIGDNRP